MIYGKKKTVKKEGFQTTLPLAEGDRWAWGAIRAYWVGAGLRDGPEGEVGCTRSSSA